MTTFLFCWQCVQRRYMATQHKANATRPMNAVIPYIRLVMKTCALVFVGWIAVQALWRRELGMAKDADALAGRCGCTGCPRSGNCQNAERGVAPEEEGHGC